MHPFSRPGANQLFQHEHQTPSVGSDFDDCEPASVAGWQADIGIPNSTSDSMSARRKKMARPTRIGCSHPRRSQLRSVLVVRLNNSAACFAVKRQGAMATWMSSDAVAMTQPSAIIALPRSVSSEGDIFRALSDEPSV
jgi:hypothetical protein